MDSFLKFQSCFLIEILQNFPFGLQFENHNFEQIHVEVIQMLYYLSNRNHFLIDLQLEIK